MYFVFDAKFEANITNTHYSLCSHKYFPQEMFGQFYTHSFLLTRQFINNLLAYISVDIQKNITHGSVKQTHSKKFTLLISIINLFIFFLWFNYKLSN